MIRRDVTLPNGKPGWSLISQTEHARLSGEIATLWGNLRVAPLIVSEDQSDDDELQAVRSEVIAAIYHHDDGWQTWEAVPKVDPSEGRPPSFLEMPREESFVIWRRSIDSAAEIGPLAGWMVAGHFLELLTQSDAADEDDALEWSEEMRSRRGEWLDEWRGMNRDVHTLAVADEALTWLRALDVLSLWLAMGESSEFAFPSAGDPDSRRLPKVVFRLADPSAPEGKVTASPWPLRTESCELSVSATLVPSAWYRTDEELAAAAVKSRLTWQLKPS